jgi:hypothetical protein
VSVVSAKRYLSLDEKEVIGVEELIETFLIFYVQPSTSRFITSISPTWRKHSLNLSELFIVARVQLEPVSHLIVQINSKNVVDYIAVGTD